MKNDIDIYVTLCCVAVWEISIYTGEIFWYEPKGSGHFLNLIWFGTLFIIQILISPVFLYFILKDLFLKIKQSWK